MDYELSEEVLELRPVVVMMLLYLAVLISGSSLHLGKLAATSVKDAASNIDEDKNGELSLDSFLNVGLVKGEAKPFGFLDEVFVLSVGSEGRLNLVAVVSHDVNE